MFDKAVVAVTLAMFVFASNASGTSMRPDRRGGFTTKIDNPWFPLAPGTTLVYKGVKDGKPQRDVFKVTKRTKVVGGVRCLVVDDRVYASGHLGERTTDYYVQDASGNVWYYGEDTAELDSRGRVTSREGT